jgi:hypothetical protein
MHHQAIFSVLAGSLAVASCVTTEAAPTAPSRVPQQAAAAQPTAVPQQAATVPRRDLRPREAPLVPAIPAAPDPETHARYSFAVGGGPRSAIDPSQSIPSPPATIDSRPGTSVDAAIKAIPSQIPMGHLSREVLESPLTDPARFARCGIPRTTRVDISVAVYNGQAIGVDVQSIPSNRAIDFCVERVARQTTWVKELAINRVNVRL